MNTYNFNFTHYDWCLETKFFSLVINRTNSLTQSCSVQTKDHMLHVGCSRRILISLGWCWIVLAPISFNGRRFRVGGISKKSRTFSGMKNSNDVIWIHFQGMICIRLPFFLLIKKCILFLGRKNCWRWSFVMWWFWNTSIILKYSDWNIVLQETWLHFDQIYPNKKQ